MKKIILTKGLPGSGKTTWAKELLAKEPGKWKRINKDDLRAMLDNGKWSKANEAFVIAVRNRMIVDANAQGYNVVVDDTNLHPKHFVHISQMMGNLAEVEIKDFTNVPLEECIKRDQRRPNYVGEKVIRRMYNQYLRSKPPTMPYSPDLPSVIICDIDGTLALFGDANPYERDFLQDEVNVPVKDILGRFPQKEIVLFSGRMAKFREQTVQWLQQNNIYYSLLAMRKTGDMRKDFIVKQELFDEHIRGKYNIQFVLDDRDQVVAYWRSIGLTCLQVDYGAF